MVVIDEDYLAHYGILRRSGRYPWGSGGNQSTRNKMFLDHIEDLRKQGLTDTEIARGFDISTTELRAARTIAKNEQMRSKIAQAEKLKNKGLSNGAIAERMGLAGESSVRALLAEGAKEKADILVATSNMLKDQVDSKGMIDIGSGTETHLGIADTKLRAAVAVLKEQGYEVHTVPVPQIGTGHDTRMKVLAPPGTTWADVAKNVDKVQTVTSFSADGGRSFTKSHPPIAIDPKRVSVNYSQKNSKGEEVGGALADGVLYIRPGVEDISIGNARYAQVRVQVGDNHYLKGMAVYKDDLPAGVDIVFNTNKTNTGNKFDAMKELTGDPDLPFGSVVRQILADPGGPNERVTSAMNIMGTKPGSGEEGSWGNWSRTLSSQVLSKQPPTLAKRQLDRAYEARKAEYDEIMSLTNPTVRKKLLEKFADGADASSVNLEAAAMERQNWRVILPVNSLKPNEVYAPTYRDGETVALIRYPHGGTFEIPEVVVNNRHAPAKKLLGDARDAIGIHHSVAERLSGADFDGDTVLVIPNNKREVVSTKALERLKNFDPKTEYRPYDGMKTIDGGVYRAATKSVDYGGKQPSSRGKGIQMGLVSNLITDMTIQGASTEEIVRAVRHSMVVIDAERHRLDWKRSAADHGIPALMKEYQGRSRGGAATLISRATARQDVPDRKLRPASQGGPVDKATGRKVYVETGKVGRNGQPKMIRSKKLAETDDANTLLSKDGVGTRIEKIYADHSNRLKNLANQARLASINTPRLNYSAQSKKTYAKEVASLDAKLTLAKMNAPRERQAQIIAKTSVKAIRANNPNLEPGTIKKLEYRELEKARTRLGAGKKRIVITPEEWAAIQAGAISNNKLEQILANADLDVVRTLATPRPQRVMTRAKTSQAMQLLEAGYTRAEVADRLGVSVSTLDLATMGDGGDG